MYSTSLQPYWIQLTTANRLLELPDGVDPPDYDSDTWDPVPVGQIPVLLDPGDTQTVNLWISNAPVITGLSKSQGSWAGGDSLIISGYGFTNVQSVKFGTMTCTNYTVNSATKITVNSTPGPCFVTVDVTVTTNNGASMTVPADQYQYWLDYPSISSLSPTTGKSTGGTTVIINGNNFTNVQSVIFGGTAAASFTVNSVTKITAVTPAHAVASNVRVQVTNSTGSSSDTSSDNFSFTSTH